MTVKELIKKLQRLDPDIECFTLDSNGHWCKIIDAWSECFTLDSNGHWCKIIDAWSESNDPKDFAYIEIYSLGPAEL